MISQPHPAIAALGFSEAGMFLLRPEAADVSAIISIHGNREYGVESSVSCRLDLEFDDIESPDPSDPIAVYHAILQNRRDIENGLRRVAPTVNHAQAIIDFAMEIQKLNGILLCHCGAGVSRSPAAALLCLAVWTGPGYEQYCMDHLIKIRPCAFPHRDLIRFGDSLLNRNGKLLAVIASLPKTAQ